MKTNSVNAISAGSRRIIRSGSAETSVPEETSEQRQRLMLGIVQAVSEISGVEESAIWVYLCSLAPDDMVEYGHVLPTAWRRTAVVQTLPSELKRYLSSIGVENKKLADKGEING